MHFSPDSTMVGAALSGRRLRIYAIPTDAIVPVGSGFIRGWTFSPDSKTIAWGRATKSAPESAGDVYTAPVAAGSQQTRLTRTGDALNPLWGAQGVVFDRQRSRQGDAPVYNLWSIQPDGSGLRRIRSPEDPAAGQRTDPDRPVGRWRPHAGRLHGPGRACRRHGRPSDGATRSIARNVEGGLIGYDLSNDGSTILGHTGSQDPSDAHDVVTLPYREGGNVRALVKDAGYPDSSR